MNQGGGEGEGGRGGVGGWGGNISWNAYRSFIPLDRNRSDIAVV